MQKIRQHATITLSSPIGIQLGIRSVQCEQTGGILNRQSKAERQNTFDWLHILPVRMIISQYRSYSANGSHSANIGHILPARVIISQYKSCSTNGSHILPVEVIFCHILQSCSVEIICSLTVNFVLFCRSALLCRFNIPQTGADIPH